MSISDMRISQQAEIRNVRFTEDRTQVQTRIIVREEETEENEDSLLDPKEAAQRKQEEDNRFFMGYFKWYWGKYGFFTSIKAFFGKRLFHGIIFSFFNSIGAAIGAFFFKRLVLSKTDLAPYV